MQIDWLTVVAQIINFLILVWLLKHFLYQPVITAMSNREQRISQELETARERERSAEEARGNYQAKINDLEKSQQQLLELAHSEAAEVREKLLSEAREDIAQLRASWQQQLTSEQGDFMKGLKSQITGAIQKVTRQVLKDLANNSLEESCVQQFIEQLSGMDDESRQAFINSDKVFRIASAFPLPVETQAQLSRAVHEQLKAGAEIQYEQRPELISGIALTTDDYRLDWNIDNYLAELEQRVSQIIETA